MGDDNSYEGKVSSFNEAAYRVKRFDELQRLIIECIMNLDKVDPLTGKYEYEKAITLLMITLNQNYGKMNPDEKKTYMDYFKKGFTYCDQYPIKTKGKIHGFTTTNVEYIDRNNLKIIRDLIMEILNFLQEVMERSGFSSPNEEKEGGYD